MKTLLALACLASLTLPTTAHQDPLPAAISSQSQDMHGLVVTGKASTTVRADTCYLALQLETQGRGFQSTQSDLEAARQKKRQEVADVLRPFGLTFPAEIIWMRAGGMTGNVPVIETAALQINDKGEVLFGSATAAEVRKALEGLGVSSSFVFSLSHKAQTVALKPLLSLAVRNGLESAKSLAALAGASTVQLTGIREHDSVLFQSVTGVWPSSGPLRAPGQALSTSVTLRFAPLNVIISTKK
nr:SIMPL domain-containing protein [Armatimonas sp.]